MWRLPWKTTELFPGSSPPPTQMRGSWQPSKEMPLSPAFVTCSTTTGSLGTRLSTTGVNDFCYYRVATAARVRDTVHFEHRLFSCQQTSSPLKYHISNMWLIVIFIMQLSILRDLQFTIVPVTESVTCISQTSTQVIGCTNFSFLVSIPSGHHG